MLVVRTDGFVDPCIPTLAAKPPAGLGRVHEIKHDGYRLIVRRDGETVRLFTRRGYDWTDRYPGIAVTASKLRAKSFTLDGEAAVCGPDGVAVFDALHRRRGATDAVLQAFDLLELNGEGGILRASFFLDEAAGASALELLAQVVRFITGERTDLRCIEDATIRSVLPPNLRFIAAEQRILRPHRSEGRLRLLLASVGRKLNHPIFAKVLTRSR
jgi:hypothetical protein